VGRVYRASFGYVTVALMGMSAAPIDHRLAADRAKLEVRGHSHTKRGSLLKEAIPRSAPGRSGTMRWRGLWRSTWSATRAATRSVIMPTS